MTIPATGPVASLPPLRRGPASAVGGTLLVLLNRLIAAVFQMAAVSVLIFIVLRAMPADPLALLLPPEASTEDMLRMREALGLDRSIVEQYLLWIGGLLEGDLGRSSLFKEPVIDLIGRALPITLELVIVGLALGIAIGIAMALASFYWRGGIVERAVNFVSTISQAIPEFLWGILLLLGLGVALQLLPFTGPIHASHVVPKVTGFLTVDSLLAGQFDAFASRFSHLILAGLAIGLSKAPLIVRVLRSSLLEIYTEEYIASARLRGFSERRILLGHALRNAILPTIALIGVQAGFTFGGTLLLEAIFSHPGLGNLMISAIRAHDVMLIQGITLAYCGVVLLLSAFTDLVYYWANPRLRAQ